MFPESLSHQYALVKQGGETQKTHSLTSRTAAKDMIKGETFLKVNEHIPPYLYSHKELP